MSWLLRSWIYALCCFIWSINILPYGFFIIIFPLQQFQGGDKRRKSLFQYSTSVRHFCTESRDFDVVTIVRLYFVQNIWRWWSSKLTTDSFRFLKIRSFYSNWHLSHCFKNKLLDDTKKSFWIRNSIWNFLSWLILQKALWNLENF